ncbi:MAG: hypothetical protein ABIV51_09095 [Saprospiraceae bacterium]
MDLELKQKGIKETFRGQAWSDNCVGWVYYDCQLDLAKIRIRNHFPSFVVDQVNDDNKSGMEMGFFCQECKDAIFGLHPDQASNKQLII